MEAFYLKIIDYSLVRSNDFLTSHVNISKFCLVIVYGRWSVVVWVELPNININRRSSILILFTTLIPNHHYYICVLSGNSNRFLAEFSSKQLLNVKVTINQKRWTGELVWVNIFFLFNDFILTYGFDFRSKALVLIGWNEISYCWIHTCLQIFLSLSHFKS